MAETNFTPGPWLLRISFNDEDIQVYPSGLAPHGKRKAEIAIIKDYHDDYEANARLIVAAPELYECLYRLSTECRLAGLEEQAGFDCWLKMADEILAKARGEAV
ncbi:hypothetical protein [Brucella anthropi]|uniref:hypothetical protein n=1 Tax=Brucella anthropi TaxID=529 RepID=UPI00320B2DA6